MTLRVTVEIVPFGVEARSRRIGLYEISNNGRTPGEFGDYNVRVLDPARCVTVKFHKNLVVGHLRSTGFVKLLRQVFAALCEKIDTEEVVSGQEGTGDIKWTEEMLKRFKIVVKRAKDDKQDALTFDGNLFDTRYAGYLIEYLEMQFYPKGEK